MRFQCLGLQAQGFHHIARTVPLIPAGDSPRLAAGDLPRLYEGLFLRQGHGLHHLAHHAVREDHYGRAPGFRQGRGLVEDVHGLLEIGRGEHGHVVIAVTAAAGDLEIIRLAGLNAADAGAAAGNVEDDERHLGGAKKAEALLHQGDAWGGGGNEHASPGSARAIGHVDRAQLAFRLHEGTTPLGQLFGHIFGYLALGGDGIAEIEATAAPHGGFGKGLVALHQNLLRHFALPPSA